MDTLAAAGLDEGHRPGKGGGLADASLLPLGLAGWGRRYIHMCIHSLVREKHTILVGFRVEGRCQFPKARTLAVVEAQPCFLAENFDSRYRDP